MDAAAMLDAEMDEWLWPASCPELRQMESTLRCLICGDFFHGPVLLPCTHTFCSECVRRFLQSRGNNGCCPECKQPCTPGELVPNRTLEKIGMLFQQMKPRLLPLLANASATGATTATKTATLPSTTNSVSGKPPERMNLLSYSVMKDKEIKKLLESIGIRVPVKNRDDIIQIHKEYVLLANAQADSSHPKSAKQIRDEVVRNYRARQAEKQSGATARKSLDAGQVPVVTAEMQAGFARLRQQVKARDSELKAKQAEGDGAKKSQDERDGKLDNEDYGSDDDLDDDPDHGSHGGWRHVHAVKSNVVFYIHSRTNEIRTEPPREYLDRQRRLTERRRERAAAVAAATERNDDGGGEEEDDEPVVVETRSAPSSQTDATQLTRAADGAVDDDDDFEIMMASPPPKPPLGSRTSTPQSLSASARKKAERRRSSIGSVGSIANSPSNGTVAAFFSQETSCSIQETSTQLAPSASLSFSSQHSSARASDPGDAASSSPDTAGSQALPLTETKWECPRCTLVNETVAAVAECEACGFQHRPARKKQKLQFQSKIFPP